MRQQFCRVALFASAGLILAACSTTGASPAYPITQPTTPPPAAEPPPPAFKPEPIPVDPPPATAPTESVTSTPLPPPAAAPATPIPNEPPIPQPPPYTPPPPRAPIPPPPPPPAPVTVLSVTGKVVEVDGPAQVHTVKKGDTIDAIARDFDMTRKELGDLNDLDPPYNKLKLGQKIKGPKTKVKAYVVGQGDTLFAISQRFKVTQKALLEANNLKAGASIRANQRITLPAGYKDGGPIRRTVTPAAPPPAAAPLTPIPYTPPAAAPAPYTPPPRAAAPTPTPVAPPPPAAPAPTSALPPIGARPATAPLPAPPRAATPAAPAILDPTAAAPSDADVVAAGRGRFLWPVKGDVIGTFGPNGAGGQRSDGLNIRAAAGEPVRAAAAGEVVYAGDQVPEFGNLVLVKHADGWVTAYAHLSRADVKMRQTVTQGQQIGTVGSSGGVAEPQLHFEVRYAPSPKDKARPINPSLVLPR